MASSGLVRLDRSPALARVQRPTPPPYTPFVTPTHAQRARKRVAVGVTAAARVQAVSELAQQLRLLFDALSAQRPHTLQLCRGLVRLGVAPHLPLLAGERGMSNRGLSSPNADNADDSGRSAAGALDALSITSAAASSGDTDGAYPGGASAGAADDRHPQLHSRQTLLLRTSAATAITRLDTSASPGLVQFLTILDRRDGPATYARPCQSPRIALVGSCVRLGHAKLTRSPAVQRCARAPAALQAVCRCIAAASVAGASAALCGALARVGPRCAPACWPHRQCSVCSASQRALGHVRSRGWRDRSLRSRPAGVISCPTPPCPYQGGARRSYQARGLQSSVCEHLPGPGAAVSVPQPVLAWSPPGRRPRRVCGVWS